MIVVAKGVTKGLEKLNNLLMPLLFIMLISLVLYSGTFTGAFEQTLKFLFKFDLSKINSTVALQALGQACFSLAIGAGAMFVYGSYLPKKVDITSSAIYVAVIQFMVGILAGLAIFPIIFAKNLPLEYGPGLMFVAIPNAFSGLFMSSFIISIFFSLLLFAALTSSINLAEPLVATLCEKTSLTRTRASIIIGIISLLLGLPSLLSFNLLQGYTIFDRSIFDAIIHISTNFMLPIGAIFYAVYATFILSKYSSEKELSTSTLYYRIWYWSVKYLVPLTLILILVT